MRGCRPTVIVGIVYIVGIVDSGSQNCFHLANPTDPALKQIHTHLNTISVVIVVSRIALYYIMPMSHTAV